MNWHEREQRAIEKAGGHGAWHLTDFEERKRLLDEVDAEERATTAARPEPSPE